MKILVFANFPPFVMGGAENQVARLVEGWMDLGHTVEVAGHAIPNKKVTVGRHTILLHHLHVFKAGGRPCRALTYLLSLLLFLIRNKNKYDVIYSRGLADAALSTCFAKLLCICNLPLVACPINAGGRGDVNFIKSIKATRYLVKLINCYCNGINCIAHAIKDDLKQIGIALPNLAEIPNGIATFPLERQRRVPGPRRLLFTGRFSHQKGLDILIKSLAELRRQGYIFQCQIIGDGPLKEALLKQINAETLYDHVFLSGPVERHDVRNLLLQADVFIMPSRYEGMSNSVLEAMEAGLPVVVTKCGGIDHYIGIKNGWTPPPNDQQALVHSLRQMLEAPYSQLELMGNANRELVDTKFTIGQVAQANIDFFNQVLQKMRE